ncbi:MAG: hypothetical protein PHC61_18495 [Chitinivibrionales bacterium]|nr:hypothetical protein [Chitinivibrionales bacterium]
MKLISYVVIGIMVVMSGPIYAQDAKAFDQAAGAVNAGLLDPSRFSIHNSLSFGMASSSGSSLKSQSIYGTMMQYKFVQPVTLNLNFGLPIFSTANSAANLNGANLSSAQYFSAMPLEASLLWQPKDNLLFRFSFARQPNADPLQPFMPFWANNRLLEFR